MSMTAPHPCDRVPTVDEPELRVEPYDSPAASLLIAKAHAVNEALYGHPDETPVDPEEFLPECGGIFLVGYLDGVPVACGGYRRHEDDLQGKVAEIKRMYVEPDYRRRGLARRLLAALEDAARTAGYTRVILDTGSKQPEAHRLYESCSYHRIPGFSIYRDRPGNRAYAKDL